MPVPAIILAAGASRRLGQPKQLVKMAGETLLERTIRVVRNSGADPVFVVVGAHVDRILEVIEPNAVRVIVNRNWEQGIATSIEAGIRSLLESLPDADAALLLVCDQPLLNEQHLQALIASHREAPGTAIIASSYAGVIGIPAIFSAGQFSELLKLRGDEGARSLLRKSDCPLLAIPFPGGEVDIDTPADLSEINLKN